LYKESELGLVPREWEVESLKTLFNIIDWDRWSNYPSQEDLLDESYCAFLSNKNIIDWKVVLNWCQYITETKHRKLGKWEILKGDLVVSTRWTIWNIWLSNNLIVKRINSGMVILRSNAYKCYSGLFLELRIHSFKWLYNKVQSWSAQPQLPIKDMWEFKFILPSKVESVKIIKIIDDVVTWIDVFKIKKKKFLLQKRWLMKDLLSGEVRVSI
jgi:type I restriction enzyme S subunit